MTSKQTRRIIKRKHSTNLYERLKNLQTLVNNIKDLEIFFILLTQNMFLIEYYHFLFDLTLGLTINKISQKRYYYIRSGNLISKLIKLPKKII